MINSIDIEAFKSIKNLNVTLKNLTLLTGLNNSGKSSVIQAIRMYARAYRKLTPYLIGHGLYDELKSKLSSPSSPIMISVNYATNENGTLKITNNDHTIVGKPHPPLVMYISADRWGPRTSLPLQANDDQLISIGDHGENIAHFLNDVRNQIVNPQLLLKESEGNTVEYQLTGWLRLIAPNIRPKFFVDSKRDSSHFEYNDFRPTNVGFGISYTIPIIGLLLGVASGLRKGDSWAHNWGERWSEYISSHGQLVLIENPEAHLHPKGQTELGKFIAKAATAGIQIIVETQSDHLMDGIRIAIKEKLIKHTDVLFHYLSTDKDGETKLETPEIYSNGKLAHWPEGFFDQSLKNKMILSRD